jgi:hypothetical protein
MALKDAVVRAGVIPPDTAAQSVKKRYSEQLSHELAIEVADSLRALSFTSIKPQRQIRASGKHKGQVDIIKEKEFQGGLGPKRVDVSYADDRHGLMLAVTIKTLNFPSFPRVAGGTEADYSRRGNFSKNVKNRFGDLTTESITLHLRFPFAVVSCLYVMPARSAEVRGKQMRMSTFDRAGKLYGTISGRRAYGDPAERFEDVTLMCYQPMQDITKPDEVWVRLHEAGSMKVVEEADYFLSLRDLYNERNPHAMVGESFDEEEIDFEDSPDSEV